MRMALANVAHPVGRNAHHFSGLHPAPQLTATSVALLHQAIWRGNLQRLFAVFPSLLLIANIIGVHEQSLHGILRQKRPFPRAHARMIERHFGLTNGAFDAPLPDPVHDPDDLLHARRAWIHGVIQRYASIYAAATATGIGFKTLHGLTSGRIEPSGAIVAWIAQRTRVTHPPEIAENTSPFRIPAHL